MKSSIKIIFLLAFFVNKSSAQKNVRTFIFGHSLINHEAQVNPTPSQETSVPHWFHFLADAGDHEYAVGGQYGFLLQHANVPPISQWGFDFVTGAWESDYEPFSAADFTNILITPGNFIQWQAPDINYYGETISPIDATQTIFDWCNEQEDGLDFFIYENWPDMGPYLSSGFPPSETEWNAYLDYMNGDFHNWFLEYFEEIKSSFPNSCVRMIPVGPIINNLMKSDPYAQIPITELYEDDAPHGRATIYFLASIATYMAMYEEKPSLDFEVDQIINPIIRDNYIDVVNRIWNELIDFKDTDGNSLVFCSDEVSTSINETKTKTEISIFPNPTDGEFVVQNVKKDYQIEVYDMNRKPIFVDVKISDNKNFINLDNLSNGTYIIIVRDSGNNIVLRDLIFKI